MLGAVRRWQQRGSWAGCGVFVTALAVPNIGLGAPSEDATQAPTETGGDPAATSSPSQPSDATPTNSPDNTSENAASAPSDEGDPEGPREQDISAGESADEPTDEEPQADEEVRPPRVDGGYIGVVLNGSATLLRVNDRDTPGAFLGGGGALRIGEAVFPWMTIGLRGGGRFGARGSQQVYQGGVMVELGFLPVPRYPLSLLVGFGVGGGATREQDVEGRAGFGGALFNASARYDFFPGVAKRRPNRGGGFSLGPEIGWTGFTPAAKGRPMSNTISLGLWVGYYFGS